MLKKAKARPTDNNAHGARGDDGAAAQPAFGPGQLRSSARVTTGGGGAQGGAQGGGSAGDGGGGGGGGGIKFQLKKTAA